ncbi:MAG: chitobiase/beta-hexosaminidase C-terminal domain-containing protein [Terracidiphilus sp.]|nr:chitobiase/beta-hexosaminidase C-terminal domain-containing protein [Terracidiphilus sp.]MDR3775649.1 chitobiase/beta-hexosaminidase C-terminal domain-containing protein [Terracidiphilus sp.]
MTIEDSKFDDPLNHRLAAASLKLSQFAMMKLLLLCAVVFIAVGCGGGGGTSTGGTTTPQAATPSFSLSAGTYTSAQSVTLTDSTSGAAIYYTTNGSTPTANSTLYTGAITVSSTETIEAIAIASGYTNSAVASATYTITLPVAATPAFSPAGGTYTSAQTVTLSDTTSGATIYYTTNGSTPTASSSLYTGAIAVSSTETIEAIAVASGYNNSAVATATYTVTLPAAMPTISAVSGTNGAQNGAQLISLSDTTPGAKIYYTTNGSTPTTSSQIYEAPFLVVSNLTVNAIAVATGYTNSNIATQIFTPDITTGTLVWSDEFNNSTGSNAQPNALIWTYDTGAGGWGNSELQNYCAWGSSTSPCDTAKPNAYIGTDGYLHIAAQQPTTGVYTSARLKTEGLFSFQYGRFEVRAMVPEAQGFWPASWLMGNNIVTVNWPACGEMDVQERVNAASSPDWTIGSIHGTGFTGSNLGTTYHFPSGQTAAGWHTYGMIWSPDTVAYYVDDPSNPYVTYRSSSISGFSGSVWPFDTGANFIILNLAIGGSYPGAPTASTPFPSETLVDYVRIYSN